MILARYGHRLVALYNARHGTSHTATTFFDEVAFPVLFGAPFVLLSVSNSPFFGAMKRAKKDGAISSALAEEARLDLHRKATHEAPDGSFVVGYPAAGSDGVTSGLVSAARVPLERDDVFATWLGAALGLTVSGGYTLLFDHDRVLWTTYEGWKAYRRLAENPDPETLKTTQLSTWNAHYVAHHLAPLPPVPGSRPGFKTKTTSKETAIETLDWSRLLVALAGTLHVPSLTAYVFALGNTNTTVGLLPVRLGEIGVLRDLQRQYFANEAALASVDLSALYETDVGLRAACARGALGLQAMPPTALAPFLHGDKLPAPAQNPRLFVLHQLWLLAMLPDRTTLYDLARTTAAHLVAFVAEGRRTDRDNLVKKQLLGKPGRHYEGFVAHLQAIVETDPARFADLDELARTLASLPFHTFRLFVTLLAFQFAGQSRTALLEEDVPEEASEDAPEAAQARRDLFSSPL